MWNLLKSELLKLRRCQILLVGLVALALCPLVQYGSQLIVEAEYRNPNYDFSALFENVVWGNTQIFLPISLVMIGGWLIDRESTHDTLKNLVTVPVNRTKLVLSKMLVLLLFAVGFMAVGGLVNLAVLLFQGWEPVGFWTLFGVGIEEGLIMWVGALPCNMSRSY